MIRERNQKANARLLLVRDDIKPLRAQFFSKALVSRLIYTLIALAVSLPCKSYSQGPLKVRYEKYALLIGNSKYTGPIFGELPSKAPDTVDVNEVQKLLLSLGFEKNNIQVRTNLNSADLNDNINEFFSRAGLRKLELKRSSQSQKETTTIILFLYFSGHGVTIQNANYLIPVDFGNPANLSEAQLSAYAIDNVFSSTKGFSSSPNVSHVLVSIIDACRSTSEYLDQLKFAPQKGSGNNKVDPIPAPLTQIPLGSLIAYASVQLEAADDPPPGKASPFTEVFVNEYGKNLSLPIRELFQSHIRKSYFQKYNKQSGLSDQLFEDISLNAATVSVANSLVSGGIQGATKGANNKPRNTPALTTNLEPVSTGYIWIGNYDDKAWAPAKIAAPSADLISGSPASIRPGERYLTAAGLNMRATSPVETGIPTSDSAKSYLGTVKLGSVIEILESPISLKNRSGQSQYFVRIKTAQSNVINRERSE